MNDPCNCNPAGQQPGKTGTKRKMVLGTGCALVVLLSLGILAVFVWMFIQFTSLPDYINRESVEEQYARDLVKVDKAIAGNRLSQTSTLDLSDDVLAIHSQKVKMKRNTSGKTGSYTEKRKASDRKVLYQAQEVTPKNKVAVNGIGYGNVLVDGQEISCVIVTRKPGARRKGGVAVLGVKLNARKRDFTEYIVYFKDTFSPARSDGP